VVRNFNSAAIDARCRLQPVSSTSWGAQRIEELLTSRRRALFFLPVMVK
jgi:hypothetical protein